MDTTGSWCVWTTESSLAGVRRSNDSTAPSAAPAMSSAPSAVRHVPGDCICRLSRHSSRVMSQTRSSGTGCVSPDAYRHPLCCCHDTTPLFFHEPPPRCWSPKEVRLWLGGLPRGGASDETVDETDPGREWLSTSDPGTATPPPAPLPPASDVPPPACADDGRGNARRAVTSVSSPSVAYSRHTLTQPSAPPVISSASSRSLTRDRLATDLPGMPALNLFSTAPDW
mmetsp:Transcript_11371/g.47594  ORF Transcript_11371/g.47594 Transcript_11371/m.47594 type:complete len:226 (-) Transcript_11371:2990-3667(-)